MGKLVKKDGKFLKKDGKFVTTDDPSKCPCCGGDGPCPPGKFCSWTPPDPCSTGKCTAFASDTPIECPEGFPYDCTSEAACNQWYEAHPNPPCDCWFCEGGEWVNNPSLTCLEDGGFLGPNPPEGVECIPPVKYICAQRICEAGADYCKWQVVTNSGVQSWFGGLIDCRNAGCDEGKFVCQYPTIPATSDGPQRTTTDCVPIAKECITEEEFNKGGWSKLSGPHDTLKICEAACNPPPECPPFSVAYYWDGSPAVPPEILDSNGGWYIRVDINNPNRPNFCEPCETPDTLVKPYVEFNANFTCDQINESLRAKDQRGPNPLP